MQRYRLSIPLIVLLILAISIAMPSIVYSYSERHPEKIREYVSQCVDALYIVKEWSFSVREILNKHGISIEYSNFTMYRISNTSQELLKAIAIDPRLALIIGGLQLRSLKLFAFGNDKVTIDDIATLLRILKEDLMEDYSDIPSCNSTFSKLLTNEVYGYVGTCRYTLSDVNNLIVLMVLISRESSILKERLVKALYLLLIVRDALINNTKRLYFKNFNMLYREVLDNVSLITALFIDSLLTYYNVTIVEEMLKEVKRENISIYSWNETIVKAVMVLEQVLSSENMREINVSVVTKILSGKGIQLSRREIENIVKLLRVMRGEEEYFRNVSIVYTELESSKVTELKGYGGIAEEEMSREKLFSSTMARILYEVNSRPLSVPYRVVMGYTIHYVERYPYTSRYPYYAFYFTIVGIGFVGLLLFFGLRTIAIRTTKRLSKISIPRESLYGVIEFESERHSLLAVEFWNLLNEIAKKVNTEIACYETHREFLARIRDILQSDIVDTLENIAKGYEVDRFGLGLDRESMEKLLNLIHMLRKGLDVVGSS